ncbi:S-adenosyl-L-methionine-dependent methyltransferase [Aspergillus leporis]|uniref:S-adenosyl-L-methionine-dependent methyltransferase n=1 Tax=Aspergillus leporis TaxID=41062 RepID=A0A5N5XB88_9EURO|nr:S-adenosyl-L-methionine-dependent methyltransferase [Aspergillus leporis]
MPSRETLQSPEGQTRLVKHFETHSLDGHTAGWTNLWDRGMPSAALIDIIERREDLFNPITIDGKKKALGCGKGYDVVTLALHGFDVYGLETSDRGASVAREYVKMEIQEPQACNFGSASSEKTAQGRGEVTILRVFDMILIIRMRRQWAGRMADLLAPPGYLVSLEFPLFKDPKLPGPPWGLRGVHWDLLAEGRDLRVVCVKPERSYANRKGTDMLSVWSKKSA